MSNNDQPDDQEYRLAIEFCIDGKGYTDRDREMFVAGWEHCQITSFLMARSETAFPRPVRAENEFRLRNLISKYKRSYKLTPIPDYPGWLQLDVGPLAESEE